MKTKFKSILRLARAQVKHHPDYTDNTDTDAIQKKWESVTAGRAESGVQL